MKALAVLLITILLVTPALAAVPGSGSEVEPAPGTPTRARENRTSFFFDFGDARSPVMRNYVGVTQEDRYNAEEGWGLLSDVNSYFHTRGLPERYQFVLPRSWVYESYKNELTLDGLRSDENLAFRVDLPNGSYRVRLWLGDLEQGVYSMNASFNGEWLLEDAAAFHIGRRSFYMDWEGDYPFEYGFAVPYTRELNVTDGKLVVNVTGNDDHFWSALAEERARKPPCSYLSYMSTGKLKCSSGTGPWHYIGGPFTNASVLGLEIYPVPELPLKVIEGELRFSREVENALIKMATTYVNLGDWEAAYALWSGLRYQNLSWTDLIANSMLGMYLAGTLEADYELDTLPGVEGDLQAALRDDPGNRGVADLLDELRRFRQGLEYEWNRITPDPDPRNTKNHFYEANKAAMLLWTIEPTSFLYPKARLWAARALMNLDPHRWTSASGTALAEMEQLKTLDPNNPYLRFYTETTKGEDRTWENPTPVVSTTGEKDQWYLEDHNANFTDAPEWARLLREELCWLYNITDWWVDHRQQSDGSIGGGWTDDVEMIGLFGFDALISEGADEKSMVGAGKFVDGMLASGQLDMEKGFSAAFADTEHSAELTGDSLPMMIATDFGNPKWIEFSYKTARLMRDIWMGENDLGQLQFKANHLSATKVGTGGQAEDSWINFRAALPAFWVWWYNSDPEIEDLLVRWANAWQSAAMSTAKNKPEGVIPAMIAWPTREIGGINSPNWYQGARNDGSVNYDWNKQQYKSYIVTLLTTAYEATGDTQYLEPLRLEAQLAQDYFDSLGGGGGREPSEGSGKWAGKVLGQGAIDRYQGILDSYGLPGARPAATLWTRDTVVDATRDGHDYIEKCYPLMTTEASATDRVAFVGIANPFLIYTGGATGGALLAPKFTYTGLGWDFAAMVTKADRNEAKILLYGFFDDLPFATRIAELRAWDLEPGATYQLKTGPDEDGDGEMDSVKQERTFVFESRGMAIPFTLPGKVEFIIELEKTANGTGATQLPDPAWGTEMPIIDKENGTITVFVHNIGGVGAENLEVTLVAVDSTGARTTVARGKAELLGPKDLMPSVTVIKLKFLATSENAKHYLLVIDPKGKLGQITTSNDELEMISLDISGAKVHEEESDDKEDEVGTVASGLSFLAVLLVIALLTMKWWYPDKKRPLMKEDVKKLQAPSQENKGNEETQEETALDK